MDRLARGDRRRLGRAGQLQKAQIGRRQALVLGVLGRKARQPGGEAVLIQRLAQARIDVGRIALKGEDFEDPRRIGQSL